MRAMLGVSSRRRDAQGGRSRGHPEGRSDRRAISASGLLEDG